MERIGLPLPADLWSIGLGYLALGAGVLEGFMAVAFWQRRAWAHPLLILHAGVFAAYFITTPPHVSWASKIIHLYLTFFFIQSALLSETKAQFVK